MPQMFVVTPALGPEESHCGRAGTASAGCSSRSAPPPAVNVGRSCKAIRKWRAREEALVPRMHVAEQRGKGAQGTVRRQLQTLGKLSPSAVGRAAVEVLNDDSEQVELAHHMLCATTDRSFPVRVDACACTENVESCCCMYAGGRPRTSVQQQH